MGNMRFDRPYALGPAQGRLAPGSRRSESIGGGQQRFPGHRLGRCEERDRLGDPPAQPRYWEST